MANVTARGATVVNGFTPSARDFIDKNDEARNVICHRFAFAPLADLDYHELRGSRRDIVQRHCSSRQYGNPHVCSNKQCKTMGISVMAINDQQLFRDAHQHLLDDIRTKGITIPDGRLSCAYHVGLPQKTRLVFAPDHAHCTARDLLKGSQGERHHYLLQPDEEDMPLEQFTQFALCKWPADTWHVCDFQEEAEAKEYHLPTPEDPFVRIMFILVKNLYDKWFDEHASLPVNSHELDDVFCYAVAMHHLSTHEGAYVVPEDDPDATQVEPMLAAVLKCSLQRNLIVQSENFFDFITSVVSNAFKEDPLLYYNPRGLPMRLHFVSMRLHSDFQIMTHYSAELPWRLRT